MHKFYIIQYARMCIVVPLCKTVPEGEYKYLQEDFLKGFGIHGHAY